MSGRGGGGGSPNNLNDNNNSNYNIYKSNNSDVNGQQQQQQMIPAGARKVVQSLKEVVSGVSDSEIYATLKDCNMDPNEAVNRLLSQDTFHEVKSKREKKKESKDTTDTRSCSANNIVYRVGKGGADRYAHGGPTQYGSNESGILHGKPAYRKENETPAYAGASSSSSGVGGSNVNRRPPFQSESVAKENRILHAPVDGVFSSMQSSSGFQSTWSGVPGQVSMADVVKRGRPQNKSLALPSQYDDNHHHDPSTASVAMHGGSHFSESYTSNVSETNSDHENAANHNIHADNEWPSIEQPPAVNVSPTLVVPGDSDIYLDSSHLPSNRGHQVQCQIEDVQSAEEAVDDATTIAANLQQLSLQNVDRNAAPEEDNPPVIIPDHLQFHGQDCSHLSFGSFGSGMNSTFPGPISSMTLINKLEETSEVVDGSSVGLLVARNQDYYGDDHIRSTANEHLMHGAVVSAGIHDSIPVHQPEVLKDETPEPLQGSPYAFTSAAPVYSYESAEQLNAAFRDAQTSSQIPDIAPFSSLMAYSNSLPSALLASTGHTGGESDHSYSHFSVMQSMPAKYSSAASSISGPNISMSEALRAASISTAQPTQQALGVGNLATGPSPLQQLAVHPYSQPTLPLGPFANIIGYPFMPQSYAYMPSAFQQTFAGNSTYQQSSLASMLPQYKNGVSASSLSQSAAVASGYGFGSSNSLPESNFTLNSPAAPTGTNLGYDDLLTSQYKEVSHLISPLQQNENSAMWVHGPGSRTMSGIPGNMYYGFQGQNQQAAGFRQAQQPSQQFSALGYPNYYQTALSQEHHQQSARDGSLVGSQGQPAKQTQHLWQNNY